MSESDGCHILHDKSHIKDKLFQFIFQVIINWVNRNCVWPDSSHGITFLLLKYCFMCQIILSLVVFNKKQPKVQSNALNDFYKVKKKTPVNEWSRSQIYIKNKGLIIILCNKFVVKCSCLVQNFLRSVMRLLYQSWSWWFISNTLKLTQIRLICICLRH